MSAIPLMISLTIASKFNARTLFGGKSELYKLNTQLSYNNTSYKLTATVGSSFLLVAAIVSVRSV